MIENTDFSIGLRNTVKIWVLLTHSLRLLPETQV